MNGSIGQSADNQIDCLRDIGTLLGNTDQRLWRMLNGYVLPSANGLREIRQAITSLDDEGRDRLRAALRIGLHTNTQVTLGGSEHVVSQAYCSALPVAYTDHPSRQWESFATLVLEASYEATICAASNPRVAGSSPAGRTCFSGFRRGPRARSGRREPHPPERRTIDDAAGPP